ncbi:MAG: glycosyltransferase, partial [Ferruginibacter sp.]|nr:glycosyltransferase [Cytophagales bacterium]
VWNFPVLAAALACRHHRVPYVISPRGTVYPETIALKSAFLKKVYYALFAGRCLTGASLVHFTAEDERDKVTRYLGLSNASVVIPNGIDLESFRELASLAPFSHYCPAVGKSPYLLFLGRISFKKGLNLLIPAFAQLVASQPQFRLVIAGPDEEGYQARLVETIVDLGISDKVFFTGMLSGNAKLAAYRDAVLFVLPSYSENFGMSVVEAMACGTPVVIADQVGIAADIEAAQAGVVTRTTVESVLAGVQGLLADPERRRQVARNGNEMVVKRYDIRQVAASFAEAYARCVDAQAGRK